MEVEGDRGVRRGAGRERHFHYSESMSMWERSGRKREVSQAGLLVHGICGGVEGGYEGGGGMSMVLWKEKISSNQRQAICRSRVCADMDLSNQYTPTLPPSCRRMQWEPD
eukprot:428044-Hanusia_phi.AAC.1